MPIQEPNEKPAIQQARASGLIACAQSSAAAASDKLALTMVEGALAAADAAEVEAQHGEAAFGEAIIRAVDDLVVHRAAELRVRMQHHRDRRAFCLGRMIAAFEPAGGTGEDDLGHVKTSRDGPGGRSGGSA